MRSSLFIVCFFVLGIIAGLFLIIPEFFDVSRLSSAVLYGLMFFVGISIGMDRRGWKVIRNVKYRVILVPLSVVAGTFIGVSLISLSIKGLSLRDSLAVGSGFGYYSLSSIFISKLAGKLAGNVLGVVALLSNIMREVLTLLLTPLLVKYFGKLAPVAAGGATAMDTTLPVIVKFSGAEYGMIAVFSGYVLTVAVPFLVTYILKYFQ